jgi:hypothetical protein
MSASGSERQDSLVEAVLALTDLVLDRLGSAPRVRKSSFPWRRDYDGIFRLVLEEPDDTLDVLKALDELKDTVEYEAAIAAIGDDQVLGPHVGHLVGDVFTRTGLFPDRLLLGLVLRAATAKGDGPSEVKAQLEAMRDVLDSEVRTRRVVAPLPTGVRVNVESPFLINAQTSIRKLDDADIAAALHLGFRFEEIPPTYGLATVGEPWGIEVVYELQAVSLPGDVQPPEDLAAAGQEATEYAADHIT